MWRQLAGVLVAGSMVVGCDGATPSADSHVARKWSEVAVGLMHTCGIESSGALYCWGSDENAQLGLDVRGTRLLPARVGTDEDWSTLSLGDSCSCALKHSGSLYCWGTFAGAISPEPLSVLDELAPIGSDQAFHGLSLGSDHGCALSEDDALYCWGANTFSQLGDGTTVATMDPVRVGDATDWEQVSAGSLHTCGIRMGALYCWGYSAYGQVGISMDHRSGPTRAEPVRVGSDDDWQSVYAGTEHTCGLKQDGTRYCWGWNTAGQFGSGVGSRSEHSDTPEQIGDGHVFTVLSVGDQRTCGLEQEGELYCWGAKSAVVPGGVPASRALTPELVGAPSTWKRVAQKEEHSCAIDIDGLLYCWGFNNSGQMGNGTIVSKWLEGPRRVSD